jgi:hypothetical protein
MQKTTAALVVAMPLLLAACAQPVEDKGCGDHICTSTEGHKLVEYRKDGELIDCRIEHIAYPISAPFGFIIVAAAGEGTILPYMRIVVRGVRITPSDRPNEMLGLRSVRIVGAEKKFNTRDWQTHVRDGAVWLRTDVLPEDRSPLAALAAIGTSESYAMRVETADGQELLVGVAQLRPTGDIARRFLACTEELRRSVGG